MENTLDPQVVNLAKAIRQSESGGDFKAKGKSGEHGAYQFTEDTWNGEAPKYGIKVPLKEATPEQQNAVAYNRIKKWKDSGKDVTSIASMWNAGEAEPTAYTGKFGATTKTHKAGDSSIGVNKFGAKYDVPAYAKSVAEAYLKLKNGEQVGADPNNPSSTASEENKNVVPPTASTYTTSPHSPERLAQYQEEQKGYDKASKDANSLGSIIGQTASGTVKGFGDALSFGGASQLGEQLGTGLAKTTNQVRGLFGGQDNSKYMEDMSFGKTVGGLGKTLAGIGLAAAPELKGFFSGAKAASQIENPAFIKLLNNSDKIGFSDLLNKGLGINEATGLSNIEKFKLLDIGSQADLIEEALSTAKASTKSILTKIAEELAPKLAEAQKYSGGLKSLAEEYPNLMKVGGLLKSGTKTLLKKGIGTVATLGAGAEGLHLYNQYKEYMK